VRLAGEFYLVQPCATSAGYEARPRKPLKLSLDEAEAALRKAGVEILRNAGIVLLARAQPLAPGLGSQGCDVTVFPTGKLLLKTTSQQVAEEATERIGRALGIAPGA
jgi:hypothetical protein